MEERLPPPASRERLESLRGALRTGWGAVGRPFARGLWRGAAIGVLAGVAAGEVLCAAFGAMGWIPAGFWIPPALWFGLWGGAGGLLLGLLLGARAGLIGVAEAGLLPVIGALADRFGRRDVRDRGVGVDADPGAGGVPPGRPRLTGGWRGWVLDLAAGPAAGRALGAVEAAARESDPARRREAIAEACREAGAGLGDALLFAFLVPLLLVLLVVLAMMLLPPVLVWLG